MNFAKNLRFLRRKAELSQSDLGDKIGIDYNTISRYESGRSTPKLDALTKLAQVFDVSIEALRNMDLATSQVPSRAAEPTLPYQRPALAASVAHPAKHKLTIAIELDGTPASLERAIARLAAINEIIAATD